MVEMVRERLDLLGSAHDAAVKKFFTRKNWAYDAQKKIWYRLGFCIDTSKIHGAYSVIASPVADYVEVKDSFIGEECVVESGACICSSVIGGLSRGQRGLIRKNARVVMSYVLFGSEIFGRIDGARVEYSTIRGNLRRDETEGHILAYRICLQPNHTITGGEWRFTVPIRFPVSSACWYEIAQTRPGFISIGCQTHPVKFWTKKNMNKLRKEYGQGLSNKDYAAICDAVNFIKKYGRK